MSGEKENVCQTCDILLIVSWSIKKAQYMKETAFFVGREAEHIIVVTGSF